MRLEEEEIEDRLTVSFVTDRAVGALLVEAHTDDEYEDNGKKATRNRYPRYPKRIH